MRKSERGLKLGRSFFKVLDIDDAMSKTVIRTFELHVLYVFDLSVVLRQVLFIEL